MDVNLPGRVWWRANRFTLGFLIVATGVACGIALFTTGQLDAALAGCPSPGHGPLQPGCERTPAVQSLVWTSEIWVSLMVVIVPILAGVMLGVGLVAREREEGTLAFAWSLQPRRLRWLAERFLLAALVVVLIGVTCGVVGLVLAIAQYPGVDLANTFLAYGKWGPLLVIRGLAALAVGSLIGAAIGRVLPAVLLSVIAAVLLTAGALVIAQHNFPTEMSVFTGERILGLDDLMVGSPGALSPEGELISEMEAFGRMPAAIAEGDPEVASRWLNEHYPPAAMVVPAEAMPAVQVVEAVLLLVVAAAALGSTALIVKRLRVS